MDYADFKWIDKNIENIFICVPKMNESLISLEGWISNDIIFTFRWTIPLKTSGKPYGTIAIEVYSLKSVQGSKAAIW